MNYQLNSRREALEVVGQLESRIKELEAENKSLKSQLQRLEARGALAEAEKEIEAKGGDDDEAARLAEIEAAVKRTLGVQ